MHYVFHALIGVTISMGVLILTVFVAIWAFAKLGEIAKKNNEPDEKAAKKPDEKK